MKLVIFVSIFILHCFNACIIANETDSTVNQDSSWNVSKDWIFSLGSGYANYDLFKDKHDFTEGGIFWKFVFEVIPGYFAIP